MKVDVRSLGSLLTSLASVALRAFVGTMAVLTLVGVVLAGLSFYFLREQHWFYGVIGATLVLVEAVAIGFVLGGKRAVALAVVHGLGSLRLGRSLVGLVFERMLGVAAGHEAGESGGVISRRLERLPLAQAEERLAEAVRNFTRAEERGGWLRRTIEARLVAAVQKLTLARFRREGTQHGGINLAEMKEELERTVDDLLIQKARGSLRLWTALVILGLPLLVAGQTWILLMLASRSTP